MSDDISRLGSINWRARAQAAAMEAQCLREKVNALEAENGHLRMRESDAWTMCDQLSRVIATIEMCMQGALDFSDGIVAEVSKRKLAS